MTTVNRGQIDTAIELQRDGTHAYAVKGFDDQGRIVLSNPWGPQGGWIKGTYYPGELHLTEDEFKKWFNTSTRVPGT